MASNWVWDDFDKRVEHEAAGIEKRLGIATLDEAQKETTANSLLDAGVGASKRGDEISSVAAFRVAVRVDPSLWKAHYNIGWQYLTIGNRLHEPFIDNKAPITAPPNPLDKGLAFYTNALPSFKRVLQLNFQLARGWCLLGQAQYYLGQFDEAQASLRKAIELDPAGEGGKAAAESLATLEQRLKEPDS